MAQEQADIKRVPYPEHPNRCQANIKHGQEQCMNFAVEGGKYCIMHGGNAILNSRQKASTDLYRIERYKNRIKDLTTHEEARSLHNEIALLRMLLEEQVNRCSDSHDLVMQAQHISDLILKIDRVVTSMHKMEEKIGNYVSKTAILDFAKKVINVITSHVSDAGVIDAISNDIMKALGD
jgi:hypothetical protein